MLFHISHEGHENARGIRTNRALLKIAAKLIGLFAILAIGIGIGFFAGRNIDDANTAISGPLKQLAFLESKPDFSLIKDVWDQLHERYVTKESIDDTKLIYGAVKGMVSALDDPYTIFFEPQEAREFLATVNGEFDGIGAEVGMRDGYLTVIAPLKNTPADRTGLLAGDKIMKIDDKETKNMSVDEAVRRIRGEKGTNVTLLIVREGKEEPFSVQITRDTIQVPSLRWEMKGTNIALISFYSFTEKAPRDFQKAAEEILRSGARGIILDLRNNPGGYLQAAVDVAGWLLPENSLVVTENFGGSVTDEHRTTGPASLQNMPLVILINEGSASASEILAGALHDERNVPLIGKKTFGKGSVQDFNELSGGSSLKMTIARWFTPSGQSIQEKGIDPTIAVDEKTSPEDKTNAQLEKALETMRVLVGQ